ncbi:anti-sigma factor family protein [Streptomyces sp. MMBL 11-3]|uniref:anti-sigma factor family protein n=1 Tax=Streptomyces sp. MMBL 11-3 TaxID=3382639 RepID=UPI0039B60DBF
MTSTTDKTGHPDVTEISDLTEGLLPPSRSADVRRHLDDCPLCADVYDSLEEIRGLLGTLPGPLRMPDDVAGRIDAALAAEALLSATAPAAAGTSGFSSADSSEGTEDSGHVSRETSTAADRPAGHSRGTTGPGRTSRSRRGRRRTVVLGAMFTAAALGLGGLLVQTMGSDSADNDSASASPKSTGSTETFAGEELDSQVEDLLTQAAKKKERGPRSAQPNGTDSGESPSVLNVPTDSVPVCIKQGIGRDAEPLASKEGSYKGTDAYLVVLPAATDTTQVTAYVVDSTCVENSSLTPGKVLLKHSYPRS